MEDDRPRVQPPTPRPEMSKGTLLKTFRKTTHVWAKALKEPRKDSEGHLGVIKKGETVMSIGEFKAHKKMTWIHVVTSLGPGWVRLKDIKAFEEKKEEE